MNRISSYIIPIELSKEKTMLIHGYSGAMDVVENSLAQRLKNGDIDTLDIQTTEYLIKRGHITTKTHEEEDKYILRMATALMKKDRLLYDSFTFAITYNCNFRCPYCFEKNCITPGSITRAMTPELADKAYSAIEKLQKNKQIPSKFITLYGGEPLLKENYDNVNYIVKKGIEKGFKFSAVTNGYDLENFEDLLSPEKICSIQVTIDGVEQVHNQKRRHYLGLPTFNKIVNNIGIALKNDVKVNVRFNTDKNNFNQLTELEKYFDTLGYTANKNFRIDSAKLDNYDDTLSTEAKKCFFTQKEFIKKHEQLNFKYGWHDLQTYSTLYSSIKSHKPLPYKGNFCGAQIGGYVFDAFGKIYPCWEVVGDKNFVVGDYSQDEIVWDNDKLDFWLSQTIFNYKECKTCKCALFCGGGCPAHNLDHHRCLNMKEIINNAAKRAYKASLEIETSNILNIK